ncbi:sodium-independent anion transporter [Desulfuromonas versatilis]|uniref:Sodium-independent anion transporter n=1 Tax=Desulfuromonas versatilis TaxID=2802975 RepID=A0ABN6E2F4_9BACT|nr:SulP family inorganic anion transporter [Desulfuromonas versatilis]BCR05704.1 sodium-independent anion transporter [Desulfuromonas versatilis]
MVAFLVNKSANLKDDVLSGLTVALALVPEAVAFAFVAGVEPLVGLYAAFMVGLITATVGGRPGMISGATGALAVVMVTLVAQHGIEYLFAAVVLMGLLQVGAGLLRLGKFVRLIPHPVMLGFVNGLAIVIFLAQLGQFKQAGPDGALHWLSGGQLGIMLGLVALTMAIIVLLPKLTRAVPAALAAIVAVTALVHGLGIDTRSVADMASVGGGLPRFHFPEVPLTLETLRIILPYSAILAAIGLIESLMTMTLIDEITETRGRGNRECIGQGVANLVTGMFGGMGGCAMIGQSIINVNSGGRGRASGIAAALFLLMFILFGSGLIEMIPLAALVGVMFMVVIGTFAWSSLQILHRIPRSDAFVLVLVSAVTVATDLAVAVGVGVVVSALGFAWDNARRISARSSLSSEGTRVYELSGPLFFASVQSFHGQFSPQDDPEEVIVDFRHSRVCDHSGLDAINSLTERYLALGKRLRLRHLSAECRSLLKTAGGLVEVDVIEDPKYHVATDSLA